MKNETTYLKITSLLLGSVVLFFATVLKLETSSFFAVFSDEIAESQKIQNSKNITERSFDKDKAVIEKDEIRGVQDAVVSEFDVPLMGALLLVDFDDLEYIFEALSVVSERALFFQDLVQTYESALYRKVKLFLFYSFIKIPSTFL